MDQANKSLLLDANIFIEAHKRYYALDICPGFWESIAYHNEKENLLSLDKVHAEIKRGGDKLWDWVEADAPADLFVSTSAKVVQHSFGEIMQWIHSQSFKDEATTKFASGADGWLIAYAKVHGMTVVTEEVINQTIQKRVPIPNVCEQFDVPYQNTFSMLRTLSVKFDWQEP